MDSMPNSIAPAIWHGYHPQLPPIWCARPRSIREYHPDVKCYVVVLDGDDEPDSVEDFEILALDALRIPGTKHFLFRYPLRQAVTASKAYLLSMILNRGHSRAVYLDSDILVGIATSASHANRQCRRHHPHSASAGAAAHTEQYLTRTDDTAGRRLQRGLHFSGKYVKRQRILGLV